ncbi:MAG TPA: MBL fold metallo-hydrolase [Thermotogota bacterium]|nr:MBL fold metallo-hydrolase [Thermotogota bacterium]HRW91925.1 MBL fold metallo-hydrolase [Thermotogota bacterium]
MKLKWYGHACFWMQEAEHSILTDPFDQSVRYPFPRVQADIVLESHQHHDHNAHDRLEAKPAHVFSHPIPPSHPFEENGLRICTFPSFHDEEGGKKRGENLLFQVRFPSGIQLLHCGDLGHALEANLRTQIGKIDILLVPVGGTYTLDGKTAAKLTRDIAPSIVCPMHYKTSYLDFPIADTRSFLQHLGWKTRTVHELDISAAELPQEPTCILFSM